MTLSTPKHPFTLRAALFAAELLAALCVGACSHSPHVAGALLGPDREALDARNTRVPLPAAPVLVSPANDASDVDGNGAFVWNAAAGAKTYRFQISTNDAFTGLVVDLRGCRASRWTASA